MRKLLFTIFILLITNSVYSQKKGFILDSLVMWEANGKDTVFSSVVFADKNETRAIGFSVRFGLMQKTKNNAMSVSLKLVGGNMCVKYNENVNLILTSRKTVVMKNRKDSNCEGEMVLHFSRSMENLNRLEWITDSELGAISTGHGKPAIYIPIKPPLQKDLNRVLHFFAKKLLSYE